MKATLKCSFPECDRDVLARGMCRKDYTNWVRRTPKELREAAAPRVSRAGVTYRTPLERFEAKFTRGAPSDCWEWQGARKSSGHGNFAYSQQEFVIASNYALSLSTGGRPEGLMACHRCDNPPCVNPRHLYWGTSRDNMNDSMARGRRPRGEVHAAALVTEAQVVEMRERFAAGEVGSVLAADYGLRVESIYPVVHGLVWAHVGGPLTFKRQGAACAKGHEWTEENTGKGRKGRICLACRKARQATYRSKKKEESSWPSSL